MWWNKTSVLETRLAAIERTLLLLEKSLSHEASLLHNHLTAEIAHLTVALEKPAYSLHPPVAASPLADHSFNALFDELDPSDPRGLRPEERALHAHYKEPK